MFCTHEKLAAVLNHRPQSQMLGQNIPLNYPHHVIVVEITHVPVVW